MLLKLSGKCAGRVDSKECFMVRDFVYDSCEVRVVVSYLTSQTLRQLIWFCLELISPHVQMVCLC